jgi:hypothetical protein
MNSIDDTPFDSAVAHRPATSHRGHPAGSLTTSSARGTLDPYCAVLDSFVNRVSVEDRESSWSEKNRDCQAACEGAHIAAPFRSSDRDGHVFRAFLARVDRCGRPRR